MVYKEEMMLRYQQPKGMFNLPNSPLIESVVAVDKYTAIALQITDDPTLQKRIKDDFVRISRKTYEFLLSHPKYHPYYMHNIFRDIFDLEKLYDYARHPYTKTQVPDLLIASRYIEDFKCIMAETNFFNFKTNKIVYVRDGKSEVWVELITLTPII